MDGQRSVPRTSSVPPSPTLAPVLVSLTPSTHHIAASLDSEDLPAAYLPHLDLIHPLLPYVPVSLDPQTVSPPQCSVFDMEGAAFIPSPYLFQPVNHLALIASPAQGMTQPAQSAQPYIFPEYANMRSLYDPPLSGDLDMYWSGGQMSAEPMSYSYVQSSVASDSSTASPAAIGSLGSGSLSRSSWSNGGSTSSSGSRIQQVSPSSSTLVTPPSTLSTFAGVSRHLLAAHDRPTDGFGADEWVQRQKQDYHRWQADNHLHFAALDAGMDLAVPVPVQAGAASAYGLPRSEVLGIGLDVPERERERGFCENGPPPL